MEILVVCLALFVVVLLIRDLVVLRKLNQRQKELLAAETKLYGDTNQWLEEMRACWGSMRALQLESTSALLEIDRLTNDPTIMSSVENLAHPDLWKALQRIAHDDNFRIAYKGDE